MSCLQGYTRKITLIVIDIVLINISLLLALFLRFDFLVSGERIEQTINIAPLLTGITIISFYIFGIYRSIWRYASDREIIKIILSSVLGVSVSFVLTEMVIGVRYPRGIYVIALFLIIVFVSGSRLFYRMVRRFSTIFTAPAKGSTRVLVIGAGDAGAMLIKEFKNLKDRYNPVAVIDDDTWKWNARINGVPVRGGLDSLIDVCKNYKVEEIIIAIPSASKKRISEIIRVCRQTKCKLKIIPGIYDLVDSNVSLKHIRDVSIEDLLGREEVKLDNSAISSYINEKVVLVTGAGGSIGSELCRQISRFSPSKLIILDNYENTAYELYNELIQKNDGLNLELVIASVREKERLREVFSKHRPQVVFHAAAHKHVVLMENNPSEAIKNNVLGTLNVALCSHEYNTSKFVLISTDKAVNPTNIMGATKRIAEMVIQSVNKQSSTEFVAVRFGNVLGSNGSVIPIFKKQIEKGGPVTVTHPEVTRFFMTIPEAVSLVIQAGAMAKGGEIFVLNMGEPVKILNLAKELIKLSGFEPEQDIKIEFVGLKKGEKLYEELLLEEEGILSTKHKDIFVANPTNLIFSEVVAQIEDLLEGVEDGSGIVEKKLKGMVKGFKRG